jgi:hypothetical protein
MQWEAPELRRIWSITSDAMIAATQTFFLCCNKSNRERRARDLTSHGAIQVHTLMRRPEDKIPALLVVAFASEVFEGLLQPLSFAHVLRVRRRIDTRLGG